MLDFWRDLFTRVQVEHRHRRPGIERHALVLGRRKAGEVKTQPAQQISPVDFRGGLPVFLFEAGEDKVIDVVAHPALIFYRG